MRKVIYKEWVKGIDTEEFKKSELLEGMRLEAEGKRYIEGTNCYVEQTGLFHGFFTASQENYDGSFQNYAGALIELEDGIIIKVEPSLIRFIDKPEDEQLSAFTKAAMQGIMSSNECGVGHAPDTVAEWAVSVAKATISELKKQLLK